MKTLLVVLMFAVAVPVAAHHSFSQYYDASKLELLSGVISEIRVVNPHVVLIVDVTSPEARRGKWAFEGNPLHSFSANGVDLRKKLLVGMKITISGWPAKDRTARAFSGREITFADKSTMLFGPTPEEGDRWKCINPGPCSFKYPEVTAP